MQLQHPSRLPHQAEFTERSGVSLQYGKTFPKQLIENSQRIEDAFSKALQGQAKDWFMRTPQRVTDYLMADMKHLHIDMQKEVAGHIHRTNYKLSIYKDLLNPKTPEAFISQKVEALGKELSHLKHAQESLQLGEVKLNIQLDSAENHQAQLILPPKPFGGNKPTFNIPKITLSELEEPKFSPKQPLPNTRSTRYVMIPEAIKAVRISYWLRKLQPGKGTNA